MHKKYKEPHEPMEFHIITKGEEGKELPLFEIGHEPEEIIPNDYFTKEDVTGEIEASIEIQNAPTKEHELILKAFIKEYGKPKEIFIKELSKDCTRSSGYIESNITIGKILYAIQNDSEVCFYGNK